MKFAELARQQAQLLIDLMSQEDAQPIVAKSKSQTLEI